MALFSWTGTWPSTSTAGRMTRGSWARGPTSWLRRVNRDARKLAW